MRETRLSITEGLRCNYPVQTFERQPFHPIDDALANQCVRVAIQKGKVASRGDHSEPDRFQLTLEAEKNFVVGVDADFSANTDRPQVRITAYERFETLGHFKADPPPSAQYNQANRDGGFLDRPFNTFHNDKSYRPVGTISLTSSTEGDAVNSELTLRLLRHALEKVVYIPTHQVRDIELFLERFDLDKSESLKDFWKETLLQAKVQIERGSLKAEQASDLYALLNNLRCRIGSQVEAQDERMYLTLRNKLDLLVDRAQGGKRISLSAMLRDLPGAFVDWWDSILPAV